MTAVTSRLILRCGERLIAVPLGRVVEVFRMVAPMPLAGAPRGCLGVVDCRGQRLPVLDLGARLGLTAPRSARQLVDGYVVRTRDPLGTVGYAVDDVREICDGPLEPLPPGVAAPRRRFVAGGVRAADGGWAPVLDEKLLLTVLTRHQLRLALERVAEAASGAPASAAGPTR
jgi:purine-binding chemotaxis protein CheW